MSLSVGHARLLPQVTELVSLPPQGSEDSEGGGGDGDTVAAEDAQGELEANGTFHSDDDSESCPICLNAFRGQAVGTPEDCAHYFCLDCIVEWSKVRWLLSGRSLRPGSSFVCKGPSLWPAPCWVCCAAAVGTTGWVLAWSLLHSLPSGLRVVGETPVG